MDINRLSNVKVAALALWSLGGATHPQHQEDVASKCFDLAPSRFSWSRYPKYPNLETAAIALRDAKKEKNGALVKGSNLDGFLLTPSGVEWAQTSQHLLPDAGAMSTNSALRQEDVAALNSLRFHKTFESWQRQDNDVETYQIADAVQLTADAPRRIILQRIDQLANSAHLAGLDDLRRYITWLRANLEKDD